jgi:acyl-coenzyme A synthetase/AMP-(fatty) acid ligase
MLQLQEKRRHHSHPLFLAVLIKMGSGMSEAGGVTTQEGRTWQEIQQELGSAGRPFPGAQAKIISTDGESKRKIDSPPSIRLLPLTRLVEWKPLE